MEQCRKAGKSHWYHETQSTMSSQPPLSLMPEAAYVNDRFLLDLTVSETALTPFESWLKPAHQLADVLFPRTVLNDRLHTFSTYERMSTALTAAQVFGVQRLCRYYAARLAPLPGPDASRESNQRLAQITQYARQLAGSPSVINMEFISYAEESGLIVPLGRWVILDVVRQIARWRDKGINLRVAVNFSARQLADQTLFTALKQALYDLNFEYCPIDVELTESCLIENDTLALSVIQQFSQLGAQIHLDDFGTGYSSLSQLARFPIDAVKLDQAFVRDIHKQPLSQSLVRAIVAVAQALNLQVIAEGVENAKEDAFLTKNGVNERQGFLFAKPMPAVSFERWYKRYQTKKMR